ncbi:MAG: hypothetical protein ACYC6G_14565 [Desulfobaccales bacterium]
MIIIPDTSWDVSITKNITFPCYIIDEEHWIDTEYDVEEICRDYLKSFTKQYGVEWEFDEDKIKPIDSLSRKSIAIIGENGLHRFEEFKQYEGGWNFGTGAPLSSQSIALLDTFINIHYGCFKTEPSIFLTRSGNLQLGWEDQNAQSIELEFFADRIEYYIESKDEEGEIIIQPNNLLEGFQKIINIVGCN